MILRILFGPTRMSEAETESPKKGQSSETNCAGGATGVYWPLMNKKTLSLILALGMSGIAAAEAGGNTALTALQAVPADYNDDIVKVSCQGANPDPSEWQVLAYQGEIGDGPRNFKIANGEVSNDQASFKVGAMLTHGTAINLAEVGVDSPQIFALAQNLCSTAGKTMTHADMVLTQDGDGSVPVWDVKCYGEGRGSLGDIRLSAKDGAVLSQKLP